MKISIITIGTPHLNFAKEGITEYMKRTQGFSKTQLIHIKEGKDQDKKILKAVGSSFCVLLDEQGKTYSSQEFASVLEKKKNESTKEISFVIGGPDGHTGAVYERGDMMMSLSRLTLPHDMALLFFTETLYRSLSIIDGHPYHRE